MTNFAYVSGDPDNLTGGAAANMVDIQGPFVDLATWLNTDLQPRVAAAVPTFVTSLPVSATDGQEIYYQADATNGIIWHLRYRAASTSPYKWEFLGGPPITSESTTLSSAVTSTSYTGIISALFVTPPLTGDYLVQHAAGVYNDTAGALVRGSVQFGAAAVSDNDAWFVQIPSANFRASPSTGLMLRTINPLVSVLYCAMVSAGSAFFYHRFISIQPVRVG